MKKESNYFIFLIVSALIGALIGFGSSKLCIYIETHIGIETFLINVFILIVFFIALTNIIKKFDYTKKQRNMLAIIPIVTYFIVNYLMTEIGRHYNFIFYNSSNNFHIIGVFVTAMVLIAINMDKNEKKEKERNTDKTFLKEEPIKEKDQYEKTNDSRRHLLYVNLISIVAIILYMIMHMVAMISIMNINRMVMPKLSDIIYNITFFSLYTLVIILEIVSTICNIRSRKYLIKDNEEEKKKRSTFI